MILKCEIGSSTFIQEYNMAILPYWTTVEIIMKK